MRTTHLLKHFSFLAVMFLAVVAWAALMYPKVKVDFNHPVNVGTETLPAGHYTFQQVRGKSDIPVFTVTKPDGTNITLTAVAISARAPMSASSTTPPAAQQTDVVLQKINGTYYLDKIWIAGRTRGWAFDIPESVKSQTHAMQQETVNGSYEESASNQ